MSKRNKTKQFTPTPQPLNPPTPEESTPVMETTPPVEQKVGKDEAAAAMRSNSRAAAKNLTGVAGQKLLAPKRPGYIRRWVKDVGNRLADVQRKGYSFVSKSEIDDQEVFSTDAGDKVSQVGGTDSGHPFRLYLMEISEEFAKEDAEEKEASRRATENQIRNTDVGPQGLSGSVQYNPAPHANHLNPKDGGS